MLDISVPRVKKVWVSTYRRVEDHLPALIQAPIRSDGPRHSRGKEKRRRVLAYLRDHAEELRPVTRKLLPPALSAVRHSSQTLL